MGYLRFLKEIRLKHQREKWFCPNSDESLYLGNGTSDHRNEKTKTLCNRKYPPKPRKTHLRNHFWPLESGFSAIATYKTYVFSKSSNVPILKFFLVIPDTFSIPKSLTEVMGDLIFLKTRSRPMCYFCTTSALLLHYFCTTSALLLH